MLVGASAHGFSKVLLAMGGIVLAAAYMLWMLQRVMLGQPPTRAISLLPDLSVRETATLVPLALLIFGLGFYPGPMMQTMDQSVSALVEQMRVAAQVTPAR